MVLPAEATKTIRTTRKKPRLPQKSLLKHPQISLLKLLPKHPQKLLLKLNLHMANMTDLLKTTRTML